MSLCNNWRNDFTFCEEINYIIITIQSLYFKFLGKKYMLHKSTNSIIFLLPILNEDSIFVTDKAKTGIINKHD